MTKPTYHHGHLRRALIDAALARIPVQGIVGLSLRALARDVGVTHAAPYRHFADKSALIAAIADEGTAALSQTMQQAMQRSAQDADPGGADPGGADPRRRLRAMGQAYVRFAVSNPAYFKVMFGPGRPMGEIEVLINAVRHARAQGEADTEHVALAAWCMVHGIATLVVDGRMAPGDLGLPADDIDGMVTTLLNARPRSAPG